MSKKKQTKTKNINSTKDQPVEVKIKKKTTKKEVFKKIGIWALLIIMLLMIFAEALAVMFS